MKMLSNSSNNKRISAAVRAIFVLFCALATLGRAANQANEILWKSIDSRSLTPATKRLIVPKTYRVVRLSKAALVQTLTKAPMEFTRDATENSAIISLPMPDGKLARFRFEESPVMAPALASRHPEIKTYSAHGIDDATATARFDWTPFGFNAIIFSDKGTSFVEPASLGDSAIYVSYSSRDISTDRLSLSCLFSDEEIADAGRRGVSLNQSGVAPTFVTGSLLRTYNLAVAATAEFTQQYGGGDVNLTLAKIVTLINQVTAVYRREATISFQLVPNETSIIFTDPDDGYTNESPSTMLAENQAKLDAVIGSDNYDIGHVFGSISVCSGCASFSGIASLGVGCGDGVKARGVSTMGGASSSFPDSIFVIGVTHEIGHQFRAPHSFNSTTAGCAGQRNSTGAYEPGSGSTIMGYSICGSDNLQPLPDLYFHTGSLEQIVTYAAGAGDCPLRTTTGNNAPAIASLSNFTIPANTPFTLTASVTDPNGDPLTCNWEEFDLGTASPPNNDDGTRPIFRSFPPNTTTSRTFPQLQYILHNANVPPSSYACDSGTCLTGELLPSTTRTINFRFTARDNEAAGGGASNAPMEVSVVSTAGPFAVTAPNTGITVQPLSNLDVTWNVTGTTAAPINAANVKISLSTDGGNTFPVILAASTPNDGTETILVPDMRTTTARIKIEVVGNIFFDISDSNFNIAPSNNGKIAFSSFRDGNYEIYVMEEDGSNPIRLTNNVPSSAADTQPAWSPDGTKIAFASARDDNGGYEIYAMNANGSNQTRLTNNLENDLFPAWSPDGTKIAFTNSDRGEIYLMDANGSNPTNLTNSQGSDGEPTWSPDGTKIAFISEYPLGAGSFAIFVMDANGSNRHRLTDNPGDQDPTWSPDGAKIAFARASNGQSYEIYAMDADGSNQINLTNHPASNQHPDWSPDGMKIAFIREQPGVGGMGEGLEIYVMNSNGSNQTRLTNNLVADVEPAWQRISATPTPTPTPIPTPTATPGTITPPGNSVVVQSPSGDESITFAQVTAGGVTTFVSIDPASAGHLPAGYQLSAESRAFDITTTALVVPPIDVSFRFPSIINPAVFASLRILHGESGTLVDRTFQHDFATKMIRARVSSLSPFVVAQSTAAPNRLLNISTRLRVETGDNVLIGGFIITGNDPKRLIIRGIGPSLGGFGVPDALQNPTLQLYQGGTLLAENDNWKDTQQVEIEGTGLPPSNDLESAIVRTLSPRAYTAILRGKDNGTGIGLVEAYDLSAAADAKLANISTRGFVATGDNVLIGGFIVGSTSGTPAAVMVRAIGPSLSGLGVPGALQNPTLDLHNSSGTVIASNDNWRDTQQVEIAGTGIPPSDDRESAIVATLASGAYTAIVSGTSNTTGVAVVEVYNVQ